MSLQQWANNELIEFTRELRTDVRDWLQANHIELLIPDDQAPG